MATRKKKAEGTAAKKPAIVPGVVKGSHLTVTTHEDGSTDLVWDDEALLRDVREAIATVEDVR